MAGTQLCLRAVPSFLDHAPGVPLPLKLRQRDARRRALGRRGADVPRPPRREGLRGERLGGAGVGVGGVGVARYFAPSLPTAAAAAAAGEAPVARAGSFPRFRGVLGAAAWPAEAVARLAGAPAETLRAPSTLPSAAAAAIGDASGSCAGATPRIGGVPGAAVAATAWLAGAAVPASRAPGAPSRGGAATACCFGGGDGHLGWLRLLGRRPGVGGGRPGLPSRRPDQHRRLRQPPLLALRGGLPRPLRGDGGAGAGPAVVAVVPLGGSHWSLPSLLSW